MSIKDNLSRADVKSLCDAAAKRWKGANGNTRLIRFTWRGMRFKSRLTNFRMLVDTAKGEPIAARYL